MYRSGDTFASLAQNEGRFFQERDGSCSGSNSSTVISPRPFCALMISGVSPEEASTWPLLRTVPVATLISVLSKSESSLRFANGLPYETEDEFPARRRNATPLFGAV